MDRATDTEKDQKVIRLHMEGVDELDGDVRLGSFIDKLAALKAALSETDHLVTGQNNAHVDFLVSELSHSSPAMVGLRGVPTSNGDIDSPSNVIFRFLEYLKKIQDRTIEADSANAKLFGHIRKLVAGAGERFHRLWIDGPGIDSISLGADIALALDDALPDVRREIGTVKGIIKRYSGVGRQPYFKMIPPIGGVEIKCLFTTEMLADAASAVEHCATVEGELKYYEDDFWPHEVKVRTISVHPADERLPTLQGIAGIAPMATGELSSEEFVRALRNGW